MSMFSDEVIIQMHGGSIVLPHLRFRAVFKSYEPGDPMGYGSNPCEALNDLYDQADTLLTLASMANPQHHMM